MVLNLTSTPRTKQNIKRMHSGTYAVSLRRRYETAPRFYDWLNLESPYVGQVIELYKDGGEKGLIAAISGTPPFGQILCLGLPDQKVKLTQSLLNNRYAQVLIRSYFEHATRESVSDVPDQTPNLP